MDKADYMGHCFKCSTTQVHCQEEERSSSRPPAFLRNRLYRPKDHVAIKEVTEDQLLAQGLGLFFR